MAADPMARLATAFIDALVEEARKDFTPAGPSKTEEQTTVLKATLLLDQAKPPSYLTFSLTLGSEGRLLSTSSTTSLQAPDNKITPTPCVEIASSTLEQLLTKQLNPLTAFARGLVKVKGDRAAWRSLAGPGRRAAARVTPMLESRLPWPTYSDVAFKPPSQWTPDLPFCQVCGSGFSLMNRRHHCRVCGRVVCNGCSAHELSGHRVCDPCFFPRLAPAPPPPPVPPPSHSPATTAGLVANMRAKLATKEREPVPCTKSSASERLLRARALQALDETRRLRRDVDAMREPVAGPAVSAAVRHSLLLAALYYSWRSVFQLGFWATAWAGVLAATSLSCQPHSAIALALVLGVGPTTAMEMHSMSDLKWLLPGVALGAAIAVVHRALQRLVRIYTTSISIILLYQTVRVVGQRVLRLSEAAQEDLFARVDVYVAPWLCAEIFDLKSVFTKFGQVLGARADVVPPSWQVSLSRLQDDMPCDSIDAVQETLKRDNVVLSSLEPKAIASASIAQVHRGVLNGTAVAVKVQHADVEDLMRADMVAFRRIVAFAAWLNPRFATVAQLLEAWEREMMRELDFENEAENLRRVGANLKHLDVVVPVPLVATRRVLVMQWIDGFKITDHERLELFGVDRAALLGRIVQAYSYQLFVDGLFNADPHPGNIFVSVDEASGVARPVLLDFGMVVTVPAETRLGYCALVHALSSLSVSGMSEAIRRAGYQNTQSAAHPERDLEFFAYMLRDTSSREEARADAKAFDALRHKQRSEDVALAPGRKVEGRAFKEFPDSLIFLMRTLGLLRGLCTQLDVPVSYLEGMTDHARLGLALGEHRPTPPLARRWQGGGLGAAQRAVELALQQGDYEGGMQVSARCGGAVEVEASAGTMGDVDPRPLSSAALMALLDLTKPLAALAVLRSVGRGGVELDAPLTGPKGAGPSLRMALCHAKTGMEDAVPPSSFAHQLMNYDRCLSEVVRHAGDIESKRQPPNGAAYHTHAFGWELDLCMRNSAEPCTLYEVVQGALPGDVRDELFFGEVPDAVDDCIASVSHGYAAMAKAAMLSGADGLGGGRGGQVLNLDLGTRALPGRAFADPASANTRAVRAARMPSFNAYGSARALCAAFERLFAALPRKVLAEMCRVHAREANALLGDVDWGLGWQVVRTASTKRVALVHHVTMGGIAVYVPDARKTVVVLASDLTVERVAVKRALAAALDEELDIVDAIWSSASSASS